MAAQSHAQPENPAFEVIETTCRVADIQNADLSSWMANLPNEKQLCPLSQLSIPGSHNSIAYWLDTSLEIAPEQPKFIHILAGVMDKATKSVVNKWSLTQSWDIKQQLIGGIRYFDLRVAYRKDSDQFLFYHGLYGHAVENILDELHIFLSQNSKEVVVLDFNHLYCVEVEEQLRLCTLLMAKFGGMIHSPKRDKSMASLQELWLAGEQVIIIYQSDCDLPILEMFPSFFSSDFITAPWHNTDSTDKLVSHISCQALARQARDQFHVTQAVLTPQPTTVIRHIHGSLKDTLADKANEAVVEWMKKNMAEEKCFSFNIVMADYVECDDLISTIIGFNLLY